MAIGRQTVLDIILVMLAAIAIGIALCICSCATPGLPTPAAEEAALDVILRTPGFVDDPDLAFLPLIYTRASAAPCLRAPGVKTCVDGWAGGGTAVCRVHYRWTGRFWDSALAHEVKHCLLRAAGRADPEHLADKEWAHVHRAEWALYWKGI